MPAAQRRFWLKMVGAASDPLPDGWVEERGDLLREIRFPKQPKDLRSGDHLVYYAAGHRRLFAVVRATQHGNNLAFEPGHGQSRWPYLLRVQCLQQIPAISDAPDWKLLGLPSTAVQQRTYRELTAEQYALACEAIREREPEPEPAT